VIQIRLERIGDDTKALSDLWRRVLDDSIGSGTGDTIIGRMPHRAWCAEITGQALDHRFLRPAVDYREANRIGSRGVYAYYNLEEGHVYHISEPKSWKTTDRYYCRVENGRIVRMSNEETCQWLSTRSV